MKTFNSIALGMLIFISSALSQVTAGNPDNPEIPRSSNYVVIGAFSIYKNAIKFTSKASKQNFSAKFELNPERNLYYVYVLSTEDHNQAIEEALRLRKESPFNDTWVYNGMLGQGVVKVKGTDINPEKKEDIADVAAEDKSKESMQSNLETVSVPVVEEKNDEEVTSTIENIPDAPDGSKNFIFKIFRMIDKASIEGDVNVIDAERSRKIGTYAGNKQITLTKPTNKEGKISLICDVFGYKKIQREITFQNPEGEGIQEDDNTTVIPFELIRLKKGDIAVMYNVYFYKDAGVMRPESRYEVTSLLNMLEENPKYRIRIHGHTNGGAHGKIISLAKESKDYFSLNNTKEGVGSAKKLSEKRANVIRDFLINKGVDEKRLLVKAWGGNKPIYEKTGSQAQSNVRVEIEILEN